MRGVAQQLDGQRFGLLTVIGRATRPGSRKGAGLWWSCQCDCGGQCVREGHELTRGHWIASCGCRPARARAIGRSLNPDALAAYGTRRERKQQERDALAVRTALLKALR